MHHRKICYLFAVLVIALFALTANITAALAEPSAGQGETTDSTLSGQQTEAGHSLTEVPGVHLDHALRNEVFLNSWNKMILSKTSVPDWLITFSETKDAVFFPGGKFKLGDEFFFFYMICKPHECGTNEFSVIFSEDGNEAWGLLKEDFYDRRFFNYPDLEKVNVLIEGVYEFLETPNEQ